MSELVVALISITQASFLVSAHASDDVTVRDETGASVRNTAAETTLPAGVGVRWSFERDSTDRLASEFVIIQPGVALPDTVQEQEIFEYSDAYYARLNVHRKASYAMIPLFILQYFAGEQLLTKGRFAPSWAKTSHTPLALGVGGLFLVNTVTGALNLSESARDPNGKTRRTLHTLMMFAADVGFVFTGILAPSTNAIEQRLAVGDTSWTPHKYVAVSSMGMAVASWLLMVLWNG